jgi:hypothetical protein
MGVSYRVWIIPSHRPFRPTVAQFADLANALRESNWVPASGSSGHISTQYELLPGSPIGHRYKQPERAQPLTAERFTPGWIDFYSQHELVLDWYIHNAREARVEFPFAYDPYPDSERQYFSVRLVLGPNYFHWVGDTVMPFGEHQTVCKCSKQLAYATGWAAGLDSGRILYVCPQCGRNFDTSEISCEALEGKKGKSYVLAGGLTFRFGLVVDCQKYFPHDEEDLRKFVLRTEFLALWDLHIGTPFEQIATFD